MPTMIEIQTEIYNTFRALEECDDDTREELIKAADEHLSMLANQEVDKVDSYAHVLREQANRIEFLKAEKKRIEARIKSATNGHGRMKDYMLSVLSMAGVKKVNGNTSTLSIRKSKAVEVDDVTMVPSHLTTIKTTTTPDKKAIKEYIESGKELQGCRIVENFSLNVR